jgi:thiosulfate dehydrogenase
MRLVIWIALAAATAGPPVKKHAVPAPAAGGTVIQLCDGQTSVEVRPLASGETLSRAEAQRVSAQLMNAWLKKHPGTAWDATVAQNTAKPAPPRPPAPAATPTTQGGTYSGFTGRDDLVWRNETDLFVAEGKRIFHDAKQAGGTIGVSCDMCHPNAANTHPETYPKFQVQLGRVALLRDMINWCVENPVKGRPFADDDKRLRALEAYIYAQRRGVPLDYGRH